MTALRAGPEGVIRRPDRRRVRSLWNEFRDGRKVVDIPGFAESLRLLIVHEGYPIQDVADMFGVSRQRVSQWTMLFGFATIRMKKRVWQESESRFVPVRGKEIAETLARHRRATRQERMAILLARRREVMLEAMRAFVDYYGGSPPMTEIAREGVFAVTGRAATPTNAVALLCSYWNGRNAAPGTREYKTTCDEIRTALGVQARSLGRRGHLAYSP